MSSTGRLVVVGAGVAGVSAAGAARAAGHDGEIVLIGDEPELPYRRPPVSKEVVRGAKDADQIRIKPAAWYEAQGITLRTGVRATVLDVGGHRLTLDDGSTLDYARLLLATGGRARRLGAPDGVHTLRSLADVPSLQEQLVPGARLVVVGAGLIGAEIAASARGLGVEVVLLEGEPLPLSRLLPPALGRMYVDVHAAHGVELHTDVVVTSVARDGVQAADGRSWDADVVVVAVGMEPDVDLARTGGLELATGGRGGIVVDAQGRTSAPDVFAAGDVADMPDLVLGGRHRVEHWQGAQNHGAAVGRAMAGAGEDFREVPWCWSDQYGLTLQVAGAPDGAHDVHLRGSLEPGADGARSFTAFFLDGGVIDGVVSIGRPADVRLARRWIGDRARPEVTVLVDESADLASAIQASVAS